MSAIISDCTHYRYRLERHGLSGVGAVAWIMVNPSVADAETDDPTIKKVVGFTERMGGGWAIVGNIFAFRSTDINGLRTVSDPHGPDNETHLRAIMSAAGTIMVGWGTVAKLPPALRHRYMRVVRIADELGCKLMCLGVAKDGHPLHPLMPGYATPVVEWVRP